KPGFRHLLNGDISRLQITQQRGPVPSIVTRRIADAEIINRLAPNAAALQIGARFRAHPLCELLPEKTRCHLHHIYKCGSLAVALGSARIALGHLHARFGSKPLHRPYKSQALGLYEKLDDIAMLDRREAVIELLVVIDSKARALFIADRREADKLPAPPDKLHLAADNLGDADAPLQFVKKAF